MSTSIEDAVNKYIIDNNLKCKLLSKNIKSYDSKLEFECECGNSFFKTFGNFKKTTKMCNQCRTKYREKEFLKSFVDKCSDDFKDEYDVLNYKNRKIYLHHNVCDSNISIRLDHFYDGQRCQICERKNRKTTALSNDEFLSRIDNVLLNFEILSEYKNNRTKVKIKCKRCGSIFYRTPEKMFQHGIICENCDSSSGEREIRSILEKYNIEYIPQYTYEDCKDLRCLSYDFYLPQYNTCIEYQGIQHFKPIEFFGGDEVFRKQQKHDEIKNNYCVLNNINLIKIGYYEYENIEQIILSSLINKKEVI